MDTPDRNLLATPRSQFEDSPVYNYINSLSPIKTLTSLQINQTFNSLSFASPPSVFTSPHISSQKESRFLRRNQFSGSCRSDLSSDNVLETNTDAEVSNAVQVSDCSANPPENFDTRSSIIENIVDPRNVNLEIPVELSRTLNYDCGSPECNPPLSHDIKTDPTPVTSDTPVTLAQSTEKHCTEKCLSFQSRVDAHGTHQLDHTKEEEADGDWKNLISDAADLLTFDSSRDGEASSADDQNVVNPGSNCFTTLLLPPDSNDDVQQTQPLDQVGSCRTQGIENPSAQSRAIENAKETSQTPAIISSTFQNTHVNFPSEEVDEKADTHIPFGSKHQRGIRRRCLVFDVTGGQKKKLEDDTNSSSSVSSPSGGNFTSEDKQLVSFRPCTSSSSCMIPGIGLHLNALAATTKDPRVVKHESLASGKELISMPSSMASFHSLSSEQKPLASLVLSSVRTDIGLSSPELQVMQDTSRVSVCQGNEDFNEISPKKRRRTGENEACKRCNCKKSKCLKLYCECFAAGLYCVEPCSCQGCFNKPVHEDTVLATRKQIESRNPLAFAPKVIRNSEPVPEVGEESNKTPASARHKRGCNCKKSSCLKKYCECFQGGVGCSMNCRCEGCKNKFGTKDGSATIGTEEGEPEEEGTETSEKAGVKRSFHNNDRLDEEQFVDHVLPVSFSFQFCRTSVQLPFSSFGKPPRSPLCPPPKFEKHFQITPDDETPEILRSRVSPISGVKTTSPNSKRVSPPNRECALSPSRKSSRKLVLQSISSFPSLTEQKTGDFQ